MNRTVFVSDTEGQNYTLSKFTEMFNVLPKGLNYNIKTDKFYSDFVTGLYNKMNCELLLTYDTPAYIFNVY